MVPGRSEVPRARRCQAPDRRGGVACPEPAPRRGIGDGMESPVREEHLDLSQLTDLERRVLTLRFGLADGQRRTLDEVAAAVGISRERVRATESEALRKIRRAEP